MAAMTCRTAKTETDIYVNIPNMQNIQGYRNDLNLARVQNKPFESIQMVNFVAICDAFSLLQPDLPPFTKQSTAYYVGTDVFKVRFCPVIARNDKFGVIKRSTAI